MTVPAQGDAAIREAAHAVLGHARGGIVSGLSKVSGLSSRESCTHLGWPVIEGRRQRPDLWDKGRIVATMAGYIASVWIETLSSRAGTDFVPEGMAQVIEECLGGTSPISAEDDQPLVAARVLEAFGADCAEARIFIREMARASYADVQRLRPAIIAVAEELRRRGALSRADFLRLIQPWIETGELPPPSNVDRVELETLPSGHRFAESRPAPILGPAKEARQPIPQL